MNFEQINKLLLDNPKLRMRRNSWHEFLYVMVEPCICYYMYDNRDNKIIKSFYHMPFEDEIANDWELFEDKRIEIKSLYHLKPIDIKNTIWGLTHITEFFIRAPNEKEAREIASKNSLSSSNKGTLSTDQLWLLSDFVLCKKVSESGNSEIIMMNFSNP